MPALQFLGSQHKLTTQWLDHVTQLIESSVSKLVSFFPSHCPVSFTGASEGAASLAVFVMPFFLHLSHFRERSVAVDGFCSCALWLLCAPLSLSEMMVLRFLLWSVICKALMRAEAYLLSRTVAACSCETFIKELKGHLTILLVMSWCLCI